MPFSTHNSNGKIWVVTNHGYEAIVVSNSDQQLTIMMQNQSTAITFYATLVYPKCDRNLRLELWGDLFSLVNGMSNPWLI